MHLAEVNRDKRARATPFAAWEFDPTHPCFGRKASGARIDAASIHQLKVFL